MTSVHLIINLFQLKLDGGDTWTLVLKLISTETRWWRHLYTDFKLISIETRWW